jgi:hypothetical protein
MKARPIISSHASLKELLTNGTLWIGSNTDNSSFKERQNVASFSIPEIDLILKGGLEFGQIHEWRSNFFGEKAQQTSLFPPHLIICSLLRNALQLLNSKKVIVWIGRDSFPSVHQLNLISQNLENWNWQKEVLLIDPQTKQERLSAFRTCLSCPGVLATIGDTSSFNSVAMRQLQFAARIGGGLGFLLRREESLKSGSKTKWLVEPRPIKQKSSPLKGARALSGVMGWNLTLLKSPGLVAPQVWEVELDKREFLLKISTPEEIISTKVRYAS